MHSEQKCIGNLGYEREDTKSDGVLLQVRGMDVSLSENEGHDRVGQTAKRKEDECQPIGHNSWEHIGYMVASHSEYR